MVNWRRFGRKRYYPGICVEGLRKPRKMRIVGILAGMHA
jgi:hypothetical protein